MAKQAGVPLDRRYHTLRTCTADSSMLRSLEGAILRGEYPLATFLGLKDLTPRPWRAGAAYPSF